MADPRVPKPGQSSREDLISLVLVKGVMAGLILCFARKPDTIEGQLKPYRPPEAMDIVDEMFKRYEKQAAGE
jgi:hypothetical protein